MSIEGKADFSQGGSFKWWSPFKRRIERLPGELAVLAVLLTGVGQAPAEDLSWDENQSAYQVSASAADEVQDFTVPAGFIGSLLLQAEGGDGGDAYVEWILLGSIAERGAGGPGARTMARFTVGPGGIPGGATLRFIIGRQGASNADENANDKQIGGGGGGGTGVYFQRPGQTTWNFLVGAGGGGGAYAGLFVLGPIPFTASGDGRYGRFQGDSYGNTLQGGSGGGGLSSGDGGIFDSTTGLGGGGEKGNWGSGGGGTGNQGQGTFGSGGGRAVVEQMSSSGGYSSEGHGGQGWGGGGRGSEAGGGGGGISGGGGGDDGGGGGGGSGYATGYGSTGQSIMPRAIQRKSRLPKDGLVNYILTPNFDISPMTLVAGDPAGSQLIEITANVVAAGPWSVTVHDPWLSVRPGDSSGDGSGFTRVDYETNTGGSRVGTVTIANQTFTVTQGGVDVVTTNIDSDAPGTLRRAIADASPGSTIVFQAGLSGSTIVLTGGELVVDKDLTIDASALPGGLTIDANGIATGHRVMSIPEDVTVSLKSLHLTGGRVPAASAPPYGGGIWNLGVLSIDQCTISGNSAEYGAGIYSANPNTPTLGALTLERSIVSGNAATIDGGGIYNLNSVLLARNSVVSGNTAGRTGGGVYNGPRPAPSGSVLNNCTLAENEAAVSGGGVYGSVLNNGIVYSNTAPADQNHGLSTFSFSCTSPLPAGLENIDADPQFVAPGDFRLASPSPCLNQGSNAYTQNGDTDLEGNPRVADGPADMGAFERQGPPVYYVSVATGDDGNDGYAWETAKRTLQAAIDLTVDGSTVLVDDGVYSEGGKVIHGALGNRVAITKAVTLKSRNGPEVTTILGARDPVDIMGDGAVRGAYVGDNAALIGFTLSNGATRATGDLYTEQSGGGVLCASSAVVINCIITGNAAAAFGGGSSGGTLDNCTLSGNTADPFSVGSNGGGAYGGILNHCVLSGNEAGNGAGSFNSIANSCTYSGNRATHYGGGAREGTLNHCTLTNNAADFESGGGTYDSDLNHCAVVGNEARRGGGAFGGILANCLVRNNTAREQGGGVHGATLYNCTLTGNLADNGAGGAFESTLNNSIVYFNFSDAEDPRPNHDACGFSHSCTTPLPFGSGNIDADPDFANAADSNFRLRATSPCIDMGANENAPGQPTDFGGNPRIVNSLVDIGAHESNGGYLAWAAAITNGLNGENESALDDGYANLVKYATGSSATESDGLARPSFSTTDGVVSMHFNQDPEVMDATLYVEASDELSAGSWEILATHQFGSWIQSGGVVLTGDGNPVSVSVEDPAIDAPSRFYRLRVTRP